MSGIMQMLLGAVLQGVAARGLFGGGFTDAARSNVIDSIQ